MLSKTTQSMFGHLAAKFSAHPENLATESLNYILNRSTATRRAFIKVLAHQSGTTLSDDLTFQTQQGGDDAAIPDLVGFDSAGRPNIIAEAKFWAGLTDAQPVTYLGRLRQQGGNLLIFVAPSRRFSTLWPELLRRCNAKGIALKTHERVSGEFLTASTEDGRVLALTSWRSLLAFLRSAAEAAQEVTTASDIGQLAGFCQHEDEEAFLPMRAQELGSAIGQRIVQFCSIVDDVTNLAVEKAGASLKGLRATAAAGWYGRYFSMDEYGFLLSVDANRWSKLRETPIWLSIAACTQSPWAYSPAAKQRLLPLELEQPPRLFVDGKWLVVPIFLPTGVERSQVVQASFAQFQDTAVLLTK